MKIKKIHGYIAVLCIIVSMTAWLIVFHFTGKSQIPDRPADTSLEFWITEDVSEMDWKGYDEAYGMFGGYAYLGKDYHLINGEVPQKHIIYTLTAWPDYSDAGWYITGIEITDPAISVYGLTAASTFSDFDNVLTKQGYKIDIEKNEFHEIHHAEKGDVSFILTSGIFDESGEVESAFIISAEVSNREGLVF